MSQTISLILCPAIILLMWSAPASGQSLDSYEEFYRMVRLNAMEQIVPCYRTSDPAREPSAIGIDRDSLGRIIEISLFFFGNLETRATWTTMRISHTQYDSINTVIERRTFFNASGMPVSIRNVFAQEYTYRTNGDLVFRKLLDSEGNPTDDTSRVSRAMYQREAPGEYIQHWYISTGKQHFGSGSDTPLHPFAPMPKETYFRKFNVNAHGDLTREEVWGLQKRPIRFPGGELVHAYELNECGLPVRTMFLDTDDKPMIDSSGIATITYEYDDSGRLVEWRSFDLAGNPRGRREDGVAGMRYTFRQFDGELMKAERFDGNGTLLP